MKASWRRREDVSKVRFILALLVAPISIAGIMWAAVVWTDNDDLGVAVVLGLFVLWFFLLGTLFDLAIARHRGKIGRWGCVITGAVAGATFSSMEHALRVVLPEAVSARLGWRSLHGISIGEMARVLTSPIGLQIEIGAALIGIFIGWLWWRIGVRPATVPIDFTEVFR